MTMITPSYLGETIEYSSLHACRSTLEDPTQPVWNQDTPGIDRPEIMQRIVLFGGVCLLLLAANVASAGTYYVSVAGSDLNTGATSQPWRTIAKAASSVAPGDTVLVQPGIYDELVYFKSSGAPAKPITFRASGAVTNRGNFAVQASYNVIDGFEFDDRGTNAFYGPVWFAGTGISNVWVINNKFHDIKKIYPNAVIDFQSNGGFSNIWTGIVISNNSFWNFQAIGVTLRGQTNLCVNNWLSNSMGSDAFNAFGHDHTFRGNRCYEINSKYGDTEHPDFIQTFGPLVSPATPQWGLESWNIVIDGNTCINTDVPSDGEGGAICQLETNNGTNAATVHDWTFRNNVFVGMNLGASVVIQKCHWYNNTFYRCSPDNSVLSFGWYSPFAFDPRGSAQGGVVMNNAFIECAYSNSTAGWYGAATAPSRMGSLTNFVGGSSSGWVDQLETYPYVDPSNPSVPGWILMIAVFTNLNPTHVYLNYAGINLYDVVSFATNAFHGISANYTIPMAANHYSVAQQQLQCASNLWQVIVTTTANPAGEVRGVPTYQYYSPSPPIDLFTNSDYNFVCGPGGGQKAVGTTWGGDPQKFYEPHGVNGGDPKLVAPGSNFMPMFGSVLIDKGTNCPGVTTDSLGNARPLGLANDIGAFEFDPSLQAWWDFQGDLSTQVPDISGHGFFGRRCSTNWPVAATGKWGEGVWFHTNSYLFDPPADLIPVGQWIGITNLAGTSLEYLTNGTLSWWMCPSNDVPPNGVYLFDCGSPVSSVGNAASNSWSITGDGNPFYTLVVYDGSAFSREVISWPNAQTDGWHHYALAFNCVSNTAVSYYDGMPYQTNVLNLPWLHSYGSAAQPWIAVGRMAHNMPPEPLSYAGDYAAGFYDGLLDEVRIYNRALSAPEVHNLYVGAGAALQPSGGGPINPPPLIAPPTGLRIVGIGL